MKEQDFMRHLGENIRTFRTQASLTQTNLAERIGRSVASVSKYERGDCAIDSYTLCSIAEVLGVTPAQLLPVSTRTIQESPNTNNWSVFTKHDRFYLYNVGFISQRLCCSQIEINWQTGEATMHVDMGRPIKGFNQANSTLYGNVFSTSACTTIWVNNPIAPIDYFHIVINSADWYAGNQICHVSYSTVDWRSVASKGVITTTPKCPPNIDELLAFTKEELRNIKKRNQVLF